MKTTQRILKVEILADNATKALFKSDKIGKRVKSEKRQRERAKERENTRTDQSK